MKNKDFTKLVNERFNFSKVTLAVKDKEYSSDTDRLHNFVVAGRLTDETPIKALLGMMKKHIVSFFDMVEAMEQDETFVPTKEWINEKFGDNINYFLLAEGLIEDRRASMYGEHIAFKLEINANDKPLSKAIKELKCLHCHVSVGEEHHLYCPNYKGHIEDPELHGKACANCGLFVDSEDEKCANCRQDVSLTEEEPLEALINYCPGCNVPEGTNHRKGCQLDNGQPYCED